MRVIAGNYKSHALTAPHGADTRPTSDRVRESLFATLDMLGMLDGARVLDLFAGSGALGIEALSRGASDAVFVEKAHRAVATVKKNLAAVGEKRLVVQGDATAPAVTGEFDLILADPPYPLDETAITRMLTRAEALLKDDSSLIVVERSARSPQPVAPETLSLFKSKTYGETAIWMYERARI